MKTKLEKMRTFEWSCILAFMGFIVLTCYAYSNGRNFLGGFALFLSMWALLIIVGRFVTGTAYLEGHVVRLIRKNQGRMKKAEILAYYESYGSFDFVLETLKQRDAIKEEGETILLLEENIMNGFRNRLMMWGTRKVRI